MGHSIEVSEERGVRYLHFGTEWVQCAMRLSRPHQLVLAYTQEMLSFLLFRPAPRNVLMIGLGGDPNKIEYDGYYEDSYVRTPQGWRFKQRVHHALLREGQRVTPPVATN